jgi:hypothetical protein
VLAGYYFLNTVKKVFFLFFGNFLRSYRLQYQYQFFLNYCQVGYMKFWVISVSIMHKGRLPINQLITACHPAYLLISRFIMVFQKTNSF